MVGRLVLLILSIHACNGFDPRCHWYPPQEFMGLGMQRNGPEVKLVPSDLPRTLQSLLLNATAITSLDEESFGRGALPELKSLSVTCGVLSSVGPRAFCHLQALMTLDLGHNQLDTLDEMSFSCNERLKTVSLANNPSLRNLPRLYSSSVERLDVSNCNLSSIGVATVDKMSALLVLNLTGNRHLHCPSLRRVLEQAWPDLLVICEDSATYLLPTKEITTSEKPISESDSVVGNNHNDSIGEEENNSKKSLNETESAVGKTKKDGSVLETVGILIFIVVGVSYGAYYMRDFRVRSYRTIRKSEGTQKIEIEIKIIPPYTSHQQLLQDY